MTWIEPQRPEGWTGLDLRFGSSLGRGSDLEQHQALIAAVHARSGTDGFLAEWLGENRLGWASDLIPDLTNVTPQTDPEARS